MKLVDTIYSYASDYPVGRFSFSCNDQEHHLGHPRDDSVSFPLLWKKTDASKPKASPCLHRQEDRYLSVFELNTRPSRQKLQRNLMLENFY